MIFKRKLAIVMTLLLLVMTAHEAFPRTCDPKAFRRVAGKIGRSLGVELSENAKKGLATTISKMKPDEIEAVTEAARNMKNYAGKNVVNEFFENVDKIGKSSEGLGEVIKEIANPNNESLYRHGIARMRYASKSFPRRKIRFEVTPEVEKTRIDIVVPSKKVVVEIKTVDGWPNKIKNRKAMRDFLKKKRDQAVEQAKYAKREGFSYVYIFDPPFPEGTPPEKYTDFREVFQKVFGKYDVLKNVDYQFIE